MFRTVHQIIRLSECHLIPFGKSIININPDITFPNLNTINFLHRLEPTYDPGSTTVIKIILVNSIFSIINRNEKRTLRNLYISVKTIELKLHRYHPCSKSCDRVVQVARRRRNTIVYRQTLQNRCHSHDGRVPNEFSFRRYFFANERGILQMQHDIN